MHLGRLGIDIIKAARRWAISRARLRRMLDSRTAKPQQVQRAKEEYTKLSDQLEKAVGRMERAMKQGSAKAIQQPQGVPSGLNLLAMLGTAAKAAEVAIQNPQQALEQVAEANRKAQEQHRRRASHSEDDDYIEAEVIEVKTGPPKEDK